METNDFYQSMKLYVNNVTFSIILNLFILWLKKSLTLYTFNFLFYKNTELIAKNLLISIMLLLSTVLYVIFVSYNKYMGYIFLIGKKFCRSTYSFRFLI